MKIYVIFVDRCYVGWCYISGTGNLAGFVRKYVEVLCFSSAIHCTVPSCLVGGAVCFYHTENTD